MTKPIRVLVADDHMIVRTGIRHVLESEPGFEVVGEAANGAEALSLAAELLPDVVVLDISMPDGSGLELAARLRGQSADPGAHTQHAQQCRIRPGKRPRRGPRLSAQGHRGHRASHRHSCRLPGRSTSARRWPAG